MKVESEIHKPFTCEELAQIKTADVALKARYMKGGIKTKAGKNRMIPIAEKILPPVEWFYNPANEYLLTLGGLPLKNLQSFRNRIWDKLPLLANHLPHDGRHTITSKVYRPKFLAPARNKFGGAARFIFAQLLRVWLKSPRSC